MIEKIDPGLVVGKLTVIKEIEPGIHGSRQWYCQCECGNYVVAADYVLRHQTMKSCGCDKKCVPEILGQQYGRLLVLYSEYSGSF